MLQSSPFSAIDGVGWGDRKIRSHIPYQNDVVINCTHAKGEDGRRQLRAKQAKVISQFTSAGYSPSDWNVLPQFQLCFTDQRYIQQHVNGRNIAQTHGYVWHQFNNYVSDSDLYPSEMNDYDGPVFVGINDSVSVSGSNSKSTEQHTSLETTSVCVHGLRSFIHPGPGPIRFGDRLMWLMPLPGQSNPLNARDPHDRIPRHAPLGDLKEGVYLPQVKSFNEHFGLAGLFGIFARAVENRDFKRGTFKDFTEYFTRLGIDSMSPFDQILQTISKVLINLPEVIKILPDDMSTEANQKIILQQLTNLFSPILFGETDVSRCPLRAQKFGLKMFEISSWLHNVMRDIFNNPQSWRQTTGTTTTIRRREDGGGAGGGGTRGPFHTGGKPGSSNGGKKRTREEEEQQQYEEKKTTNRGGSRTRQQQRRTTSSSSSRHTGAIFFWPQIRHNDKGVLSVSYDTKKNETAYIIKEGDETKIVTEASDTRIMEDGMIKTKKGDFHLKRLGGGDEKKEEEDKQKEKIVNQYRSHAIIEKSTSEAVNKIGADDDDQIKINISKVDEFLDRMIEDERARMLDTYQNADDPSVQGEYSRMLTNNIDRLRYQFHGLNAIAVENNQKFQQLEQQLGDTSGNGKEKKSSSFDLSGGDNVDTTTAGGGGGGGTDDSTTTQTKTTKPSWKSNLSSFISQVKGDKDKDDDDEKKKKKKEHEQFLFWVSLCLLLIFVGMRCSDKHHQFKEEHYIGFATRSADEGGTAVVMLHKGI